ncbi:MAG TPA: ribose 5-phosphate isomerase B [Thermodesulfovibrionia bacterium]|nr:ribose 5-phosphate isomerase B [Thermodesulfovibrionia bacterium]
MKIRIGCDHAGYELKQALLPLLKEIGVTVEDAGCNSTLSVDYVDYGEKVSEGVSTGEVERGILICGTGIGMSIVANKFPHVRASLCNDVYSAKMSRLHNDANILVMAGRVLDVDSAEEIVRTWFATSFEGGRHQRRLEKIEKLEKEICDV